MSNPVLFVSLGPGDPELVTLKALKALQKADAVFCPAAEFHYFENAGIAGKEFYSYDREVILDREFPYFSLVIVRLA